MSADLQCPIWRDIKAPPGEPGPARKRGIGKGVELNVEACARGRDRGFAQRGLVAQVFGERLGKRRGSMNHVGAPAGQRHEEKSEVQGLPFFLRLEALCLDESVEQPGGHGCHHHLARRCDHEWIVAHLCGVHGRILGIGTPGLIPVVGPLTEVDQKHRVALEKPRAQYLVSSHKTVALPHFSAVWVVQISPHPNRLGFLAMQLQRPQAVWVEPRIESALSRIEQPPIPVRKMTAIRAEFYEAESRFAHPGLRRWASLRRPYPGWA